MYIRYDINKMSHWISIDEGVCSKDIYGPFNDQLEAELFLVGLK